MGEPYHSEFNISHENVYAELARVKGENYHLKRQLKNKNNINRGQSKLIASLQKELKQTGDTKQHYRNGRKRGSHGFNG